MTSAGQGSPGAVAETDVSYLFVLSGIRVGDLVALSDVTTIGSHEHVDVHLPCGGVAGEHARIVRKMGLSFLAEMYSGLGTMVNGTRVTGLAALKHGDTIDVGDVALLFFTSRPNLHEDVQKTAYIRASRDQSTGAYTRGFFSDRLIPELCYVQRSGQPAAIMLLSPRTVAPQGRGQQDRDALMRALFRRVQPAVRPSDILARYAQDAFVLFCRGTNGHQALMCGQRLRNLVACEPLRVGDALFEPATVEVGIYIFFGTRDGLSYDDVMPMAERALSRARAVWPDCIHVIDATGDL